MNPQKIISELYSYGEVKDIIYKDFGANLRFESKQDIPKQYVKFIDEQEKMNYDKATKGICEFE